MNTRNQRFYILWGADGVLAALGWWTNRVQKAVKRWRQAGIPDKLLERYYADVAAPVVFPSHELSVTAWPHHWQCVFELGQAIAAVMATTTAPERWVLLHACGNAVNGQFPKWETLAWEIEQRGGRDTRGRPFTRNALVHCARRLHLVPDQVMVETMAGRLAEIQCAENTPFSAQ